MKTNPLVRPFLKWAGGKRFLIPQIENFAPKKFNVYFEPFIGSGAVLFYLQPAKAIVNDKNPELINCYKVIKDSVEELLELLGNHQNNEEYFYTIRDWDRSPDFLKRSPIERASRIIFLNKTCYNGLFRVNSQGQFNVPFGRYASPNIADSAVLRAVSHYLNSADITFLNLDFADAVESAQKNDFIYLDPPYDPVSDTASFTGYDVNGFDKDEQWRLKFLVDELSRRKCKVMLSNSYTDFICTLYAGYGSYRCEKVEVPRFINSNAQKRGKVDEILVMNYGLRAQKIKK